MAAMPAQRVPGPRLPRPPAPRAARGDGPDRDQPRRLGDRALRRLCADRLARADPVRLRRGLATVRPPTVLLTGSLGSGKTMALELLLYQAFLQGSTPIVDIDPKGDHRLDRLPAAPRRWRRSSSGPTSATAGCTRCGSRRAHPRRPHLRLSNHDAPQPGSRSGRRRSAVRWPLPPRAAQAVGQVLDELRAGTPAAEDAARALEVHLDTGLARLGYARPGLRVRPSGRRGSPPSAGGSP